LQIRSNNDPIATCFQHDSSVWSLFHAEMTGT